MNTVSCHTCQDEKECPAKRSIECEILLKFDFLDKLSLDDSFWSAIAGKCSKYKNKKERMK